MNKIIYIFLKILFYDINIIVCLFFYFRLVSIIYNLFYHKSFFYYALLLVLKNMFLNHVYYCLPLFETS